MRFRIRLIAVLFLGVLAAISAAAQKKDVPNSKDHALITRYPGSTIYQYTVTEFDEIDLPLSKVYDGKFAKSQHLEGKITKIDYEEPAGHSILEIYRNYESALQKGGFTTLWSCANVECGGGSAKIMQLENDDWSWGAGHRALTAKLTRPEGDAYVSLHIGQWSNADRGSFMILYVVEMKPMASGLVTVDAAAMGGDITRSGHTAIYGILFDTNKAEVKPESDAALQEISKLLGQTPALKLYVVGHTDNIGTMAANMDLSKRRAEAVVQALATKYKIAATRLTAMGCGPLAPVASNEGEDGRAKNRRVELVKQ